MSKAKQKIEINGVPYGTGCIGMRDSTFKELPANIKQGDKLKTLTHFRNCVASGDFLGDFTIGNHTGYLFKQQENNILVDKDVRMVLAAYKDKTESPIHICKPKINKSKIKPLEPLETKRKIITNGKIIQIGELTIDISKIELSDHFLKRCKERFYITDKVFSRKFMEDILLNGEYIGVVKDADLERETHLFSKRGIAVHISLDKEKAVTTYEQEVSYMDNSPKELIKKALQKRINKLKMDKSKINKRNKIKGFERAREMIDLEERMFKTRYKSVKLSCQARINALKEESALMDTELKQIHKELNDYTKSISAFT